MPKGLIYFKDGEVVAESGDVKVYEMNNELFLEIGPGHNLWALSSELPDYVDQLWDLPKGNCLEIGLGLGVASNYILSCPNVVKLTTVEKNEDVITTYDQVKQKVILDVYNEKFKEGKKHLILNADGLLYAVETKQRFDFIFLDFYSVIDEDTIPEIADMATACKRVLKPKGKIVGWFDKHTPEEYVSEFFTLF
jgi:spermidine synthase